METQALTIRRDGFTVSEIRRKDASVLRGLLSTLPGSATSADIVERAVAGTARSRLLAVSDAEGHLMVMPFEISSDDAATVGLPLFHPRVSDRALLLSVAADRISALGARTVHIALPCEDELGSVFADADFRLGPRMLEMSGPVPEKFPAPAGAWLSYAPDRRFRFAQAFYMTLEGTRDFPEFPACKQPARLMRAFEERGTFTCEDFAILLSHGETAGILFVTLVGSTLEIAYMGLVPSYRGKGLSRVLMARAVDRAKSHGASEIKLMVDDRNAPAIAIYTKSGLSEKHAVRVYFRSGKKS